MTGTATERVWGPDEWWDLREVPRDVGPAVGLPVRSLESVRSVSPGDAPVEVEPMVAMRSRRR
ncbi:hypothetical protein GCM10023169_12660 [Georgenia halophila]|uniref:Uncharacterized protein n=1 Tax=Georgenia halophila TaxID=620889 RepID=A0ABP8L1N5_9MICO